MVAGWHMHKILFLQMERRASVHSILMLRCRYSLVRTANPRGWVSAAQSALRLSRFGTSGHSYNESAEFRITHGGPYFWGSRLDLFVNGASNQTNVPDQHAMTWQYNGNVGIGTIYPRSLLDVAKPIDSGQLGAVLGRLTEGDSQLEGTFLGVRGYGTQTNKYEGKSFAIEHSFYGLKNSSINFYRGQSEIGGFITFSTFDNTERMRINPSGDVGIGTTTPKEKLSVNGKIRAHEVKVEIANWPDYVFEEGYKVVTLEELGNYIKSNKHLPGMPTAKEIGENGLALGEIVRLQQEKIEELILHLIEKEKSTLKQEKLLKTQAEQLAVLEERLRKIENLDKNIKN